MIRALVVAAAIATLATSLVFAATRGPSGVAVSTPTDEVFSAGEIRREFRRQGLPLRELPNGGTGPRIFASPAAGPVFNVDLYTTVGSAAAAEDLIFVLLPAGYRIRGQLTTQRNGNVVVVFEGGRRKVRDRLIAALATLDNEPALSSAEFARAASAACGRFVKATRGAEDPGSDDLAANAAYLDEIIPPLEVSVRELRNLKAAESARTETDALVGRYETLLQAEIDLRDAARRDDMRAFGTALRRVIALTYETTSRASELGWTLCAGP